ncbi:MAG: hypothetical protein C0505_01420 [Leptothrix sp. (in: Bacteria)]|nr:hypothetical protein [Leptothrix sp. (in: b-proteobacteria)]
MLDAAEARRLAQARQQAQPGAADGAAAATATTPTAKPSKAKATQAEPDAAAADAQRTGAEAGTEPRAEAGEGRRLEATDRSAVDDTPLADLAPGADAAALLAGLAALPRPGTAEAGPRGTGAAGARASLPTDAEAAEARAADELRPLLADGANGADKTRGVGRPGGATPAGQGAAVDDGEFAPLMRKAQAIESGAERAADLGAQRQQATAQPATEARVAAADAAAAPAALLATAAATGVAGPSAGASPAGPARAQLAATPGSPEFATQLGTQLTTFVREGVQHARLELHPLELGPVTVQIALDGSLARVNLAAELAGTRQALEQAMPTLASSLREAGLTLSGGGVFEQASQPQTDGGATGSRSRGGRGERDATASVDGGGAPLASLPARRRGVVDLVA